MENVQRKNVSLEKKNIVKYMERNVLMRLKKLKKTIAYKVCNFNLGKYMSAYGMEKFDNLVEYKLNEWSERPKNCGPLATFSTLPAAIEFIKENGALKTVFKCKIKKSKDDHLWNTHGETLHKLPPNTVLADKVKLIELIEVYDFRY